MSTPQTPIADAIPDPATVRAQLAAKTREAALLRSMLRLAERNQKRRELDRQHIGGKAVANAR